MVLAGQQPDWAVAAACGQYALGPCWVRNRAHVGVLEAVGELLEPVGEQRSSRRRRP
jgi:hypothetical protein